MYEIELIMSDEKGCLFCQRIYDQGFRAFWNNGGNAFEKTEK